MSIYVLGILGESRSIRNIRLVRTFHLSSIASVDETRINTAQWVELRRRTHPDLQVFPKLTMEYGWNILGNLEKMCSKSVTLMNKLCTDCI